MTVYGQTQSSTRWISKSPLKTVSVSMRPSVWKRELEKVSRKASTFVTVHSNCKVGSLLRPADCEFDHRQISQARRLSVKRAASAVSREYGEGTERDVHASLNKPVYVDAAAAPMAATSLSRKPIRLVQLNRCPN